MKNAILFCILISAIFCRPQKLLCQDSMPVDDISTNLKQGMEILKVPNGKIVNAENVTRQQFQKYNLNQIDDTTNVYWIRFTLTNTANHVRELLVSTFYFDSVKVYLQLHDTLSLVPGKNGYLVPPLQRAFVHDHTSLVPIKIDRLNQTYYFQLFASSVGAKYISKTSFRIGFYAYTSKGFSYFHQIPRFFHMFMLGALLLVTIYNSGIYIALRNKSFIYLAIYNITAIFWVISFGGFYISLFGMEDLELERTIRQASSFPPLMVSYMLLTINFLHLKNYSKSLYNAQLICLFIAMVIFILYLKNYFSIGNFIGLALLPFYYLLPAVSAIFAMKKKITGSKFFFVATLVMMCGILSLVTGYSFTSVNYMVGQYIYQFCLFIEVIIFSFAGTEVIMKEHREKLKLQFLREKDETDKKNQYNLLTETLYTISEKNIEIERLKSKFENEDQSELVSDISKKRHLQTLNTNEEWVVFKIYFDQLFTNFSSELITKHPYLTINEQRLCSLVKMGLKNREIASMQSVTIKGVEKSKERLKKKLQLDKDMSLNEYLMKLG